MWFKFVDIYKLTNNMLYLWKKNTNLVDSFYQNLIHFFHKNRKTWFNYLILSNFQFILLFQKLKLKPLVTVRYYFSTVVYFVIASNLLEIFNIHTYYQLPRFLVLVFFLSLRRAVSKYLLKMTNSYFTYRKPYPRRYIIIRNYCCNFVYYL